MHRFYLLKKYVTENNTKFNINYKKNVKTDVIQSVQLVTITQVYVNIINSRILLFKYAQLNNSKKQK